MRRRKRPDDNENRRDTAASALIARGNPAPPGACRAAQLHHIPSLAGQPRCLLDPRPTLPRAAPSPRPRRASARAARPARDLARETGVGPRKRARAAQLVAGEHAKRIFGGKIFCLVGHRRSSVIVPCTRGAAAGRAGSSSSSSRAAPFRARRARDRLAPSRKAARIIAARRSSSSSRQPLSRAASCSLERPRTPKDFVRHIRSGRAASLPTERRRRRSIALLRARTESQVIALALPASNRSGLAPDE